MHELSLATELVSQLSDVLTREGAQKAVEIRVAIGAMSGVERVPFEFAFPVAAEGTPIEGAKLVIEEVALKLRCHDCGLESTTDDPIMVCPSCGSMAVEIIEGKELTIKSMEVC